MCSGHSVGFYHERCDHQVVETLRSVIFLWRHWMLLFCGNERTQACAMRSAHPEGLEVHLSIPCICMTQGAAGVLGRVQTQNLGPLLWHFPFQSSPLILWCLLILGSFLLCLEKWGVGGFSRSLRAGTSATSPLAVFRVKLHTWKSPPPGVNSPSKSSDFCSFPWTFGDLFIFTFCPECFSRYLRVRLYFKAYTPLLTSQGRFDW